jgi:hypothetical protein
MKPTIVIADVWCNETRKLVKSHRFDLEKRAGKTQFTLLVKRAAASNQEVCIYSKQHKLSVEYALAKKRKQM